MDDPTRTRRRPEDAGGGGGRLRDQPLLPLPSASCARSLDSLSTAIQTTLPAARSDRDTPERRFVRAVLARYVWLPDTPCVASRYDRQLARLLFERGVELLAVEAGLLLVGARRALREPWLAPLPQVRSFAYYQPTIAEVLDNPRPPDLDYLTCLLRRLRPLAELKLARLRHRERYGNSEPGRGSISDPLNGDSPCPRPRSTR
jgi:hypothetical protein